MRKATNQANKLSQSERHPRSLFSLFVRRPLISVHLTSTKTSTSTLAPNGSAMLPTAARACRPASPNTCSMSSLAPFATCGCCVKPASLHTNTPNRTTRTTRSSGAGPLAACPAPGSLGPCWLGPCSLSASAIIASAFSAHCRAAAFALSSDTALGTAPIELTLPSINGSCPETYTRLPVLHHGTYAATAFGGVGSTRPRAANRDEWCVMSPSVAGHAQKPLPPKALGLLTTLSDISFSNSGPPPVLRCRQWGLNNS
jgi:hypothetical protein